MRRFAWISAYLHLKETLPLPTRRTIASAGYDLAVVAHVVLPPRVITSVPTGLKVYLPQNELLLLSLRSSLALKRGLMMSNGVGIIDADYVDNPDNEGHIQLLLYNTMPHDVVLERGERVAQGVFLSYHRVDEEIPPSAERVGGFGSTTKLECDESGQ